MLFEKVKIFETCRESEPFIHLHFINTKCKKQIKLLDRK